MLAVLDGDVLVVAGALGVRGVREVAVQPRGLDALDDVGVEVVPVGDGAVRERVRRPDDFEVLEAEVAVPLDGVLEAGRTDGAGVVVAGGDTPRGLGVAAGEVDLVVLTGGHVELLVEQCGRRLVAGVRGGLGVCDADVVVGEVLDALDVTGVRARRREQPVAERAVGRDAGGERDGTGEVDRERRRPRREVRDVRALRAHRFDGRRVAVHAVVLD